VIEPSGADVVRPTVAADDPHASPDQMVEHAAQVLDGGTLQVVQPTAQCGDPFVLGAQL
jgi:hypothetical protein